MTAGCCKTGLKLRRRVGARDLDLGYGCTEVVVEVMGADGTPKGKGPRKRPVGTRGKGGNL